MEVSSVVPEDSLSDRRLPSCSCWATAPPSRRLPSVKTHLRRIFEKLNAHERGPEPDPPEVA
jgi:hypothetical protein